MDDDFFFRENMRETRDKGRTVDYTLEELIFAEDATMIGWEEEIDAMKGMVKARNFGSYAERVDEEKGLGIKCGKADHGEKAGTISPDLLGCRQSQDGQGDDDTSMRIQKGAGA